VLQIFNLVEALFWAGVAVGVLVFSKRLPDKRRRIAYVAATVFLLFGLSDLVEIYTGAWWKPLWLLSWKGSCIVGLLACLIWYSRAKRQ
jgi:hypothetical protein